MIAGCSVAGGTENFVSQDNGYSVVGGAEGFGSQDIDCSVFGGADGFGSTFVVDFVAYRFVAAGFAVVGFVAAGSGVEVWTWDQVSLPVPSMFSSSGWGRGKDGDLCSRDYTWLPGMFCPL